MKFLIFLLVVLVAAGCSNDIDQASSQACLGDGRYTAVLIRKGCEAYVFQVTGPSELPVQAQWTDIFSKKKYTNVFSVLNYCDDSPESKILQSLDAGSTVQMDLETTTLRCLILCFAFEDAPMINYKASTISQCYP